MGRLWRKRGLLLLLSSFLLVCFLAYGCEEYRVLPDGGDNCPVAMPVQDSPCHGALYCEYGSICFDFHSCRCSRSNTWRCMELPCDDPPIYPEDGGIEDGSDSDSGDDCPRDEDGDGHMSMYCGGDDCDDSDPEIYPGAFERCNGIDDNCDHIADESYSCQFETFRGCSTNVGECEFGTEYCIDCGYWGPCEGGVLPADEICDELDNDCDGENDEDFDLESDSENCGECFNACEEGKICTGGSCHDDCSVEIQALSDEIHAIEQGCTAIFRLGHPLMELLGFQLVCGPQNTITEEEARGLSQLCSGDMLSDPYLHGQFVFCDKPTSEELCAFSASADTGMLTFEGWTVEWWSEITFPDTWRSPVELGENCGQQVDVQIVIGRDLTNCNRLATEEVDGAIEVVFKTAIPAAFVSNGSIMNVVVLRFPIEFDMVIPRPADWIVLINGTSCPGVPQDSDGDGFVDYRCGGLDCDDSDPTIHPGAMEVCGDGVDQDCDGLDIHCECVDEDGDGYVTAYPPNCAGTDCDDTDPTIHPGAYDWCDDGIDQNCDGEDAQC